MSIPETMDKLVGKWCGINRLYTIWMEDNPVRETDSVAEIELTARGRFLKIEYDWTFDNSVQEGLILIGNEKDSDLIKAFWIDSWHLGDKFMVSDGNRDKTGSISLNGYYAVPDHPDWSWRTVIELGRENSLKIIMHNISPEGEETLAVEMELKRQK